MLISWAVGKVKVFLVVASARAEKPLAMGTVCHELMSLVDGLNEYHVQTCTMRARRIIDES